MKQIKAGIIGGAGYTGGEMIRLLINHPSVSISFIHSTSNAGNQVSKVQTLSEKLSYYLQIPFSKTLMCYFSVLVMGMQKNSSKQTR